MWDEQRCIYGILSGHPTLASALRMTVARAQIFELQAPFYSNSDVEASSLLKIALQMILCSERHFHPLTVKPFHWISMLDL